MKKDIVTDVSKLKSKCTEVETEEEVKSIVQDLEDSLAGIKGFGLAAIQIGILKQVAIIRVGEVKIDLINPIIIAKSDKTTFPKEGCLSMPGLVLDTDRYQTIVTEIGLDKGPGTRERMISTGIEAVVVQHEVDHLNGITILDRVHRRKK